ncbi:hypothetical protein WMF30_44955 [Sorangium sp. So ce134]
MSDRQGSAPTRASLRKLLKEVLPLDHHLDALCIDRFPRVADEFTAGMPRTEKENLLLRLQKPAEILEKLRQDQPEKTRQHEALLAWEVTPADIEPARSASMISTELRERILGIISGASWSPDELAAAYHESAPPEWRRRFDGDRGADLAQRMLRTLATVIGQSDGAHPILRFALYLAKYASAQGSKDALFAWVVQAAEHLGIASHRLQALQRAIEGAGLRPPRDLHLVIVMQPSAAEPERYDVKAFRVLVHRGKESWSDDDARLMDAVEERPYAIDEMPALLNELLDELVGDLMLSENELTIETVVPLKLLGHDAARWERTLALGDTSPFGVVHDLVVRSWERAYSKDRRKLSPGWAARWRRLHDACEGVSWACDREDAGAGLVAKLLAQRPACVALRFAPLGDEADGTPPVLRTLITMGTPAVVWPREPPPDEARLKDCVSQIVAAPPPRAWPRTVTDLRREAHGEQDPAHPGHYLAVLWDDPNKLLPDARPEARLASPSRPRSDGS